MGYSAARITKQKSMGRESLKYHQPSENNRKKRTTEINRLVRTSHFDQGKGWFEKSKNLPAI